MNKLFAKYLVFLPGHFLRSQNTVKYIHEFEKTEWFSKEKIEEIQFKKLLNLIQYSLCTFSILQTIIQKASYPSG